MITPSEKSIFAIYGAMLNGRFPRDLPTTTESLLDLISRIPASTVRLWSWVRAKLLPSPAKFHYIFNLRELSRVFQGVLRCPADLITTTDKFLHLWRHECQRVFMDKLTTNADKNAFVSQLDSVTKALLEALLPALRQLAAADASKVRASPDQQIRADCAVSERSACQFHFYFSFSFFISHFSFSFFISILIFSFIFATDGTIL